MISRVWISVEKIQNVIEIKEEKNVRLFIILNNSTDEQQMGLQKSRN